MVEQTRDKSKRLLFVLHSTGTMVMVPGKPRGVASRVAAGRPQVG